MSNWLSLTKVQQIDLFNQISAKTGLPAFAIEKDAWVTLLLRMLFKSAISQHIVFKGGTSLSKAYNLIERFSEDIDMAIDREFLGFKGDLTPGQIRKLRRASHDLTLNELPEILKSNLAEYGIDDNTYEIEVPNTQISDKDPEVMHVNYHSVFVEESYLQKRVLIEIGARSQIEPFESREIGSLIYENYKDAEFVEECFKVNTVIPQKTFLEKMILLHEEFQKIEEKIKIERMSRHLYDIYRISKTEYGSTALTDEGLFRSILDHREKFTPVRNMDYKTLTIQSLNFIPPDNILAVYETDYRTMQINMIHGESPKFNDLIEELKKLNNS